MALNVYNGNASGQVGNYGHSSNWSLGHIPTTGEDVLVPAGAGPISSGLDQSAVAIRSFTRQAGHTSAIGTSIYAPLVLNISGSGAFFDHAGTGTAFISLGASAIAPLIRGTGNAFGGYGLYLIGSALTGMIQENGNTYLVGANIDGLELRLGQLFCDRDCVLTAGGTGVISNLGGNLYIEAACDIIRSRGGNTVINGTGAVVSILADGGTVVSNTSGTVSTATADLAGVIDFTKSNTARTVTTISRSGDGIVKWDSDRITVTNVPTSAGPSQFAKAA